MAKRKKQSSKVQKRKGATARPKAKKSSKAARGKATKRAVARGKPKRAPMKKAARPAAPALEALANLTPPAAKPGEKPTAPEKNQEADRPGEGTANSTASPNGSQFLFAGRFAREDKANERVKQLQRLDLPANVVVRHPEGRPAPIYLVVTGPFGPKRLNSVKEQLESKGIQNVQPIKVPELGQHQ